MKKIFKIVRLNMKTGERDSLEGKGAFVTREQLAAMNKAALEDKTGYEYLATEYREIPSSEHIKGERA